jgi:holo-[acyl-carrier protein] synthase
MASSRTTSTRAAEVAGIVDSVVRAQPFAERAIASVGVDVVDIERFKQEMAVGGERFLSRLLTDDERRYCAGRVDRLATRVAAKEAIVKALGTGIRGVDWLDIEVQSHRGRPVVVLSDAALRAASRAGLGDVHLSLSHEAGMAVAVAIGDRSQASKTIGGGDERE